VDPKQCFFGNDCCGIIVVQIQMEAFGDQLLPLAQDLPTMKCEAKFVKAIGVCFFLGTQAGLRHLRTSNPEIQAIGNWA
jgi:hypothetical protein